MSKSQTTIEQEKQSNRRVRGQSIYFDIDSKNYKKYSGLTKKLRPLIKSKFYRKKSTMNLGSSSDDASTEAFYDLRREDYLTPSEVHKS